MRRSPPSPTPPIAQAEEERRVLAEVSFGVTMRNLRLRYSAELCDTEVVDNACEHLGLPAVGTLKQKAARCYMEITMEITPGSK